MSADFSARYSLREIRSTADPDFAIAISIYVKHTAPGLRTDSNEIAYWLDNYGQLHDDRFHICAFYINKQMAGFCQLVFLKDRSLIVIDYMTIDEKFRGGLHVFFEFVEHMKAFVGKKFPAFDYVVAEIATQKSESSDDGDGLSLVRLLKMCGFGVINAPYIQPPLGNSKPDSELAGALLIFPKPVNALMSKTGYIDIVRAIYFQHYVRWYAMHGEKYRDAYEASIETLFRKLQGKIKQPNIVVNGLKHFPQPAKTVEENSGFPFLRVIAVIAVILGTLTVVLLLDRAFNLDAKSTVFILLAVLLVFFSAAALFAPRATGILKDLVKAFRSVSGKIK